MLPSRLKHQATFRQIVPCPTVRFRDENRVTQPCGGSGSLSFLQYLIPRCVALVVVFGGRQMVFDVIARRDESRKPNRPSLRHGGAHSHHSLPYAIQREPCISSQ